MATPNKNLDDTIVDELGLYGTSLVAYLNNLDKRISNLEKKINEKDLLIDSLNSRIQNIESRPTVISQTHGNGKNLTGGLSFETAKKIIDNNYF